MGRLGGVLGVSWRRLGDVLGGLGASWARLGASWRVLGRLGGVLGRLGGVLGASLGHLGHLWGVLGVPSDVLNRSHLGARGAQACSAKQTEEMR